jgi:hypothetical protein
MRLVGWNDIPSGHGAEFDLEDAPWWLRLWFRTPFIDRFAYPVVVRRGYGWLTPHRGVEPGPIGDVGWRLRPSGYEPAGSVARLRRINRM